MVKISKTTIIVTLAIFAIITFIIILLNNAQNGWNEVDGRVKSLVGNIQFKGKVINYRVYDRGGRPNYMICVRLDYSNVKDVYISNDIVFVKIKNNKAEMAAGFLDKYNGVVDYVEVNMNKSGIQKYTYKNGEVMSFDDLLPNSGLPLDDTTMCN